MDERLQMSWSPNAKGTNGVLTLMTKDMDLKLFDFTIEDYVKLVIDIQNDIECSKTLLKKMNVLRDEVKIK